MFGFLVFILFVGVIIVLIVLSSVLGFIRSVLSVFGIGRRSTRASQDAYQHSSYDEQANKKQKVFAEDEGEYVDYEEIK